MRCDVMCRHRTFDLQWILIRNLLISKIAVWELKILDMDFIDAYIDFNGNSTACQQTFQLVPILSELMPRNSNRCSFEFLTFNTMSIDVTVIELDLIDILWFKVDGVHKISFLWLGGAEFQGSPPLYERLKPWNLFPTLMYAVSSIHLCTFRHPFSIFQPSLFIGYLIAVYTSQVSCL